MPTHATKRQAVLALIQDPAWQQQSTHEMARPCGVRHAYVIQLRNKVGPSTATADAVLRSKHGPA